MRFLCLMPTYGRPRRLVENAIACFLQQDYPLELRHLLILDDGGQIAPHAGSGNIWEVHSTPVRYPTLPAKYAAMLAMAEHSDWDAMAVWDDDDVYLPWHLNAHARQLQRHGWSHPQRVWSTYTGQPLIEDTSGRFHGSLAVRRDLLEQIGGWPQTPRADFDQQFIWALAAQEAPGDPAAHDSPGYVFRWETTGAPHCQSLMSHPGNTDWYDRVQPDNAEPVNRLNPELDHDAAQLTLDLTNRRHDRSRRHLT